MRLALRLRPHLPQQHYTFENENRKTCYERRAYVQERRRNPCDQLCKMYDHGRGHDT
jgi:hypothetical protein